MSEILPLIKNYWGPTDDVRVGIEFAEFEDQTKAIIIESEIQIGSISAYASLQNLQETLKVTIAENVVNNVDDQRSSHTPGQKDGIQEHPLSKKTSDYEEKYFTNKDDGEGKDDREKFITGKKPEQKANVEDTEGHVNPTKKVNKAAPVAEELDSLNQQRVQELLEKYGPTQG